MKKKRSERVYKVERTPGSGPSGTPQTATLFARNQGRQIAVTFGEVARKTRGKKKLKKNIFCEKFLRACADGARVRHLAQQGRLKHLLATGPSMRIVQGTAIFG